VGGANSAGQAALYLASRGCGVTLAVRGKDVASGMSSYLLDRLGADPRVRTDVQLDPYPLSPVWAGLGRSPLPFETSEPGVFAAGDVRSGSMNGWPPPSEKAPAPSSPFTPPSGRPSDCQ
jgi:thioredoxin reductase (NADPH)